MPATDHAFELLVALKEDEFAVEAPVEGVDYDAPLTRHAAKYQPTLSFETRAFKA